MTAQEFQNTDWSQTKCVKFRGITYEVVSFDTKSMTVSVHGWSDIPCEAIELPKIKHIGTYQVTIYGLD